MGIGPRVICAAVGAAAFIACSSQGADDGNGEINGTAPGGGATGPGISGVGGGGIIVPQETGTGGAPGSGILDPEDACAGLALKPEPSEQEEEITTTTETEIPEPVAIYIMLDNSGSMDDGGARGSNSKWEEAVDALTTFVNDPASADIDVAIQYFHPEGVGNNPDECDGSGHEVPDVEMGRLPDHAEAIVDSLNDTGPDGNTPTIGALTGATDYCAQFQAQNPDERCVVVLVTDGQPNGCGLSSDCGGGQGGGNDCVDPNSEAELTPIAASALVNNVLTFTIGMAGVTDDGFALLDAVAVAGGTDCTPDVPGDEACDVSTTGADGFLAALNSIRESIVVTETVTEVITTTVTTTLPCQWEIPPPPAGETFDPNLINVNLVTGGTTQLIVSVPSEADCGRVANAWYYDDPVNPTSISVCPATCDLITSQADATIDVLFGCKTRIELPE